MLRRWFGRKIPGANSGIITICSQSVEQTCLEGTEGTRDKAPVGASSVLGTSTNEYLTPVIAHPWYPLPYIYIILVVLSSFTYIRIISLLPYYEYSRRKRAPSSSQVTGAPAPNRSRSGAGVLKPWYTNSGIIFFLLLFHLVCETRIVPLWTGV